MDTCYSVKLRFFELIASKFFTLNGEKLLNSCLVLEESHRLEYKLRITCTEPLFYRLLTPAVGYVSSILLHADVYYSYLQSENFANYSLVLGKTFTSESIGLLMSQNRFKCL